MREERRLLIVNGSLASHSSSNPFIAKIQGGVFSHLSELREGEKEKREKEMRAAYSTKKNRKFDRTNGKEKEIGRE